MHADIIQENNNAGTCWVNGQGMNTYTVSQKMHQL